MGTKPKKCGKKTKGLNFDNFNKYDSANLSENESQNTKQQSMKSVQNKMKTNTSNDDIFGDFDDWSIDPFGNTDQSMHHHQQQQQRKNSIIIKQSETECIIDSNPFDILSICQQKPLAQSQQQVQIKESERRNTKSDIMNLYKTTSMNTSYHPYPMHAYYQNY